MVYRHLNFTPMQGLHSPHLQLMISNLVPNGDEPPSTQLIVQLRDGDRLCCEVSTPARWKQADPTLMLIHGVGGSHLSPYMIRLSRKFYNAGHKVVRVNLRGCGSGFGMNERPYNCGNSEDICTVLELLKKHNPESPITLVGFSLGGSLSIKTAGELGSDAHKFIHRMAAICPVLDFPETSKMLSHRTNWLYHQYYLSKIKEQGKRWIKHRVKTLKDIDDTVTAPIWGYKNAHDYYEKSSAINFLPHITIPCDLLLAADDPFINPYAIHKTKLSSSTTPWLTQTGAHMGFIGSGDIPGPRWMDNLLLHWFS